jgi:hypothetical protein
MIINNDNKLYQVIRVVKETSRPNIKVWKEYHECDICLKQNNFLYFCRNIDDAVIEDEILLNKETETTETKNDE